MALIKFGNSTEFLKELESVLKAGLAEPPVVRHTHVLRLIEEDDTEHWRLYILILTTVVGSDLWRLECCCGTYWKDFGFQIDDDQKATEQGAFELLDSIEEECGRLGVRLARGEYKTV